jgi:hypothetical protein
MPNIERVSIDVGKPADSSWESFVGGFQVSARGNLWQQWNGLTLTVFARPDGWAWCIADSEGPTYSPIGYDSEYGAIKGLWGAVTSGDGL